MSYYTRLLAAVAAAAITIAGVLPLPSAYAADSSPEPTSAATAEPSSTATPTADPTETAAPTADPNTTPIAEPTGAAPTADPSPSATPTPAASPSATSVPQTATVTYSGSFNRLSTEDGGSTDESLLFSVTGFGFLRVDASALSSVRAGVLTVAFAVPEGLVLDSDPDVAFGQLAAYSTASAPIVALSISISRGVAERSASAVLGQTPHTAAVHKVYAVLVSPNSTAQGSSQTAAGVATSVAHADDYWSEQSSGSVQFDLAGTTSWYKSANSCKTEAGVVALWNEAAAKAKTQLGYVAARNVHLVLFFPSDTAGTKCAGAIGMASVGWSANEGGVAWVAGTGSEIAKATLAHELGHNLSLGHANWVHCSSTVPRFAGTLSGAGCDERPYGDVVDVMGYGIDGLTGGALSSPGAIRSSIWPASAYVTAPTGVTDYTLNAVSSNAGLRAVVLEDPSYGDTFFVEFRSFTDEDAQYASYGCYDGNGYSADACVAPDAGVRVLRIGGNPYGLTTFPGDDSLLLGRLASGEAKLNYTAGQTFATSAGAGSTVQVLSIASDGSSATIRVTRLASSAPAADFVYAVPTVTYDNTPRVGDVWTAMLGSGWHAESYAFQWYRNELVGQSNVRTPIAGATDQEYTLSLADLGYKLSLSVVGTGSGGTTVTKTDPDPADVALYGYGYGPVQTGVYRSDQPGAVAVERSGANLAANVSDWPSGTTFAYQWYRAASATATATAISAATASSYVPTSSDAGQFIKVRVTATPPGYSATARYSTPANYSLLASSGAITLSGVYAVGGLVTATNTIAYSGSSGAVVPTGFTYQWLRNGVSISGATDPTYAPVAADYGTKLSLRVVASAAAYAPNTSVSSSSPSIIKGTIQGNGAAPTMVKTDDGIPGGVWTLAATLPSGSITESGVTYAYQWYRDATAISLATAAVYRPVAADYGYDLKVRITITKLNYDTRVLYASPVDFSFYANPGSLTVQTDGSAAVGETVTAGSLTYSSADGAVVPAQSWQWYRNGVAIAGATAETYALTSTDYNTAITFRVTLKAVGLLGPALTSIATAKILLGTLEGSFAEPTVSKVAATKTLTVAVASGTITTPTVAYAYQWFRGGVAITGATLASYTLTTTDFGALIHAKVTVTKLNYSAVALYSDATNYSVVPGSVTPVIAGELRVGAPVSVANRTYVADGATVTGSVTEVYQWYRSGVAIAAPLGTARVYNVVAADLGKALTVKVTASLDGFLAATATSAATQLVGTNTLEGWNDQASVTVTMNASTRTLTAASTGIDGPLPVTVTYQWYRGSTAVSGKTTATYALTSADYGQSVWVRVTTAKSTFTTIVKTSPPVDYSITGGTPTITSVSGAYRVGAPLSVTSTPYATKDGALTPGSVAWQWYRNGVAITGATSASYTPVAADYNTALTVRVTAAELGYVSRIVTSAATVRLAKGVIEGSFDPPTVSQSTTGLLTASLPSGSVTTPTVTIAYQWYRNNVAISLATKSTFQLASADYGTTTTVKTIVSKLNYTSTAALASAAVNYSVVPSAGLVVSGLIKVGETVSVNSVDYSTKDGPVVPTVSRQWLRNGATILGATGATYTVQSTDFGAKLSVRVTAVSPGFVTSAVTSPLTATVGSGTWQGSFAAPVVVVGPTGQLSATITAGAVTTPGATFSYLWLRDGVAISGATSASFNLTPADWGRTVSVKVTASKSAMSPSTNVLPESTRIDYSLLTSATPTVVGTAKVGETVSASAATYTAQGSPITPTVTWQWYRNGVAISGATASSYVVQSVDFGVKLTVRVTAVAPGWATYLATSPTSATVVSGELLYDAFAVPTVAVSNTGLLSATLPAGAVTSPGVTLGYQWLRNGATITGATSATFQLTSADSGKVVSVRITASKSNVTPTSRQFTSVGVDYSIVAVGSLTVAGDLRVGELASVNALAYTVAGVPITPTLSYAWLRNGVAISGATASTYIIQSSDFGAKLSVRVAATHPGSISSAGVSLSSATITAGELSFTPAVPDVSVSSTARLTASLPAGTVTSPAVAYSYQWLRNGVAISGATSSTFQLSATDLGKLVSVRITVSKANVVPSSQSFTSVGVDYSVVADEPIETSGTATVDSILTADPITYSVGGDAVTPTITYQWLRSGVAISGAVGQTYRVQSADLAARLSVRVTAAVPGWITSTLISELSETVTAGTWQGSFATPEVTAASTGILSVTLPAGTITTTGATLKYQWLRNGVAVSGATAATFALLADSVDKAISVIVTPTKSGMAPTSYVLPESTRVDYSIVAAGAVTIGGDAKVDSVLSASTFGYSTASGAIAPTINYQWLRNGMTIAGAAASTYRLQAADLGTRVSVRVTASSPGWISRIVITPPTDAVAKGDLVINTTAKPDVAASTGGLLTATLPAGTVTTTGVTLTYAWYRNGVAITGATKSTFQLTTSDVGKTISVRVTISKLNMNVAPGLMSDAVDYSVVADDALEITGSVRVGAPLGVDLPEYSTAAAAPLTPTFSYQWMRAGVAITGATGATYTPGAADLAKTLTVRVVASSAGRLALTATSPATSAVASGIFGGDTGLLPIVTGVSPAVLSVALAPGSVTDTGTTVAYQWLRNGSAISGATSSTYILSASADYGAAISARITVSKTAYTTLPLTSPAIDRSVYAVGVPAIDNGAPSVGDVLAVAAYPTFSKGVDAWLPAPSELRYQWYLDGVAVVGSFGTASSYTVTESGVGQVVTVRVTTRLSGYLSATTLSAGTAAVTP